MGLRYRYREYTAEFASMVILMVLGLGVIHTSILYPHQQNFFGINWGWGLALTMAIYSNAGMSGAHLNPAVTLALAISRGFPWAKVPGYIFTQTLGAFCAAGIVYGVYHRSLDTFDGGIRQVTGEKGTAGLYAGYPQPYLSNGNAFLVEFLLTCIMMFIVLAIGDRRNATHSAIIPLAIGLMLVCIGVTIGGLNGYSLNPARDMGPRLFLLIAGWGTEAFSAFHYYFWIPMVAPTLGAIVGAILFDFIHLVDSPDQESRGESDTMIQRHRR
ncbi:aquaporin [Basidiobolus meristosporus CBS 931.73]|uniref:Aquaporin n=1 Tax=Basidiobolus meristosporus CBS 931.73 TaxID=1314790 RepID=A0A1Y1XV25_9FUNG|nr:aquaporin [Basidiobolus meristosporus CBS 931.73]|eukprot:ORX89573.1 aquaporin [Basidiobolus meristosporus CBS 931.73]